MYSILLLLLLLLLLFLFFIFFYILFFNFWPAGINPVGTKTLEKKMKITNCNRLAGSERALE